MTAFAILLAVLAAAGPAASGGVKVDPVAARPAPARVAAGHPDFSGRWKLDMKRSDFGSIPGGKPVARTDQITHREPNITQVLYLVNGSQRDTATYHYRTTGEETHSTIDGRDVQSVTRWEGSTLQLDSKRKLTVFDVTLNERWNLSPDGRTLTMTRKVKSPIISGSQRLIFTKE